MKLKTKLKQIENRDYIQVIIEGDYNDGDYNTTVQEYSIDRLEDEEFLMAIYGLDSVIKPRESSTQEIMDNLDCTEEEAEEIEELVFEILNIPSDDYGYCHTITSVDVKVFKKDGTVYTLLVEENI